MTRILYGCLWIGIVVACSLSLGDHGFSQEKSAPGPIAARTDANFDSLPAEARARLGTLRFRNPNGFCSIAFTPDGKRVLTGGRSGACLWDAATGRVLRRYGEELPQPDQPAHLSPDGRLVAVGGWSSDGGGGGVYEVETGRRLYRFGTSGIGATGIFSPDGKILAFFPRNDGAVVLLDAASGKELRALLRHDVLRGLHYGNHAAFFPNSETLVSALGDGIRFWDVRSGNMLKHLDPPEGVGLMALAPTGKIIATVGRKSQKDQWGQTVTYNRPEVVLWDAATAKELRRLPAGIHDEFLKSETGPNFVAFSQDGRHLAAGGRDGLVRVWDADTGKEVRRFQGDAYVHGVAFGSDKRIAIIEGQSIRLRNFDTGADLAPSAGHRTGVSAVVSPDGRLIATRGGDQSGMILWDSITGQEVRRFDGEKQSFRLSFFAPDGKKLSALRHDYELWIWDTATGVARHRRKLAGAYVLAQTRDGKTLAVRSDKSIALLDAADGSEFRRLSVADDNLTGMDFTPDGKALLVWSHPHGKLHRWDLATAQHSVRDFYKLENYPFSVEFSPDGRLITFGVQNSAVLPVVDLGTGREICRFALTPDEASQTLTWVAFSPDNRTVAWGGRHDGSAWLGEIASGAARHRLVGHSGRVQSLSWSADGTILVTGSADTTALVWDMTAPLPADAGRGPLAAAELLPLWDQLAKRDAMPAYAALRRLAADPQATIDFLARRLSPAPPIDRARIKTWILNLSDATFAVREQATRELLAQGELALPSLRAALAGKPELEVNRRLERLIEQIDLITPESLRAVRAVETLERIATPAARVLLKRLAGGAPEARLTREAQDTLRRLGSD